MRLPPHHPQVADLALSKVLDCLGDPLRLTIVKRLAEAEGCARELRCRDFSDLGTKSKLTYHFDRLREAGIVHVRLLGTGRYLHLRRHDLDERFPELLTRILRFA